MKLTVIVGADQEASFDISLYDNSFTRKWVDELSWCLDNCDFNQLEAFASNISLIDAGQILTQSCITINKYLKNFIEVRNNIVNQPQDYFNYLHSKFELLSGNFGKPTRLFTVANQELKDAIRNLNFFVHRVETKKQPVPRLYVSFNKDQYRRQAFEQDDYDFFEFEFPAGTLFLHYVELGKEFIDLYEDNLTLDYSGFKNLHYYSGEASIMTSDYSAFKDEKFKEWLVDQGVDPYNKKLGHGKIPLGKVDNLAVAVDSIAKFKYINKILIKEINHGKTV
jgi:hypothetical protein